MCVPLPTSRSARPAFVTVIGCRSTETERGGSVGSAARARVRPMTGNARGANGARVLIIVQNLPVPLDRRVWLECQALTAAGYGVSVICPRGPDDPRRQVIDGVRIYKYAPPPAARGVL